MLSVVGRVLMQVGCKKFATAPRLSSVKGLPILPNELQGTPPVSLCATESLAESH